jgi:hypothetical protein
LAFDEFRRVECGFGFGKTDFRFGKNEKKLIMEKDMA